MTLCMNRIRHDQQAFWVNQDRSLVARGYDALWEATDGSLTPRASLRVPWPYRCLATLRPLRQALRLGLHNLWPLADGGLVGVARKVLLRCAPGQPRFDVCHRLRWGTKPGFNGLCTDPEGHVYYGEYVLNPRRALPIALYRSDDSGCSYKMIHEFPAGQIRHIHFIQWDSFGACLWMGTGDADHECLILRSHDYGATWRQVGGGSQLWRTVGLAFTHDAVYWGTDAGSVVGQGNYVVRLDRTSDQIRPVQTLQGPCHGFALTRAGTLLACAGVEGGANEQDAYAHLWASQTGAEWQELAKWKKDPFPLIVQFGVIHFPHALDTVEPIHFNTKGLAQAGEAHYVCSLST